MNSIKKLLTVAVVATCAFSALHAEEEEDYSRWYFSPGIGFYLTEGDQPLKDGLEIDLRLGYDINEWWSIEGGLLFAPSLDEQFDENLHREINGQWRNIDRPTSHSRGKDKYFDDTYMAEIFGDLLFHFTRWERLDPYLAGGVAFNLYGKDVVKDGSSEFALRAGAGLLYHFSEEWAFRADWRILLTSDNTEFNSFADVGLAWYWGAGQEPIATAIAGPTDSDGDGLTDEYELRIGTDPNNPDTDGDGLTDGDEVLRYKTDPLNKDSDMDGLTDGQEVLLYKTNPLDPDTDKGGVSDGHEVIDDKTDPLDPNDDFLRFELHLLFKYDKADLNPKDFPDLDKVAAVLLRNPGATAVVEGHADRLTRSKADYNRKLSERRANAAKQYLVRKGVSANRIRAVGYGFDRPQYKPDLIKGTPLNRRVEVYIKGASDKNVSDTLKSMRR